MGTYCQPLTSQAAIPQSKLKPFVRCLGSCRNRMNDCRTSHAFQLERARREIQQCGDTAKLQALCLNLLQQTEVQREMLGKLLLEANDGF